MSDDRQAAWQKLLTYSFDKPDSRFPFSAKVARENGWSLAYTLRVIEEYRKFAFLAATAGHPVSPPDTVDQAWHTHILYTYDYWKVFCPEYLGFDLHHGPTKGGAKETAKFQDWYAKTLASYEAFFGEKPPVDIWPTVEQRAQEKFQHQRVDKARHWVIRKPRFSSRWFAYSTFALPLVACGCAAANGATNPLDYDGQSFIGFYMMSFLVAYAAAWIVRSAFRPPNTGGDLVGHLSPEEVAMLNGGSPLVLRTALASLRSQDCIQFNGIFALKVADSPSVSLTPLEERIMNVCSSRSKSLKHLEDALSGS
ncbi:MAG: TIGR04222 domain-containing membrane protein, partial [Armatimonadota bacterium]